MQKLVTKLSHQRDIKIDFRKIPGADHYFADRLDTIVTHVEGYIGEHLGRGASRLAAPAARVERSQSAKGSRTSTVSSRSGLVEKRATGAPISSSSRRCI